MENNHNGKSVQRDANTARQKFSPHRRPLSGGAGPPKFNQLVWYGILGFNVPLDTV